MRLRCLPGGPLFCRTFETPLPVVSLTQAELFTSGRYEYIEVLGEGGSVAPSSSISNFSGAGGDAVPLPEKAFTPAISKASLRAEDGRAGLHILKGTTVYTDSLREVLVIDREKCVLSELSLILPARPTGHRRRGEYGIRKSVSTFYGA